MKIRMGFVSNSSSSSFVILGIATEEGLEDAVKLPSGRYISSLYTEGIESAPNINYVTGYVVADGDEESFACSSELLDINNIIQEVAAYLEIEPQEVKLITGVRPC